MSIKNCIEDARFLWNAKRYESAFALALIAVAATSKKVFPNEGDGKSFESFLVQGWFEKMHVEFRGKMHSINHIFYKWFRCELIHEGKLPLDVEFIDDLKPGVLSVRAGGEPTGVLQISYGWFDEIIGAVIRADVNRDIFPSFHNAAQSDSPR